MLTMQEIFDTVVQHLLTQNEKSVDTFRGTCLYRTPDGKKCAVGALIPDDEYNVSMESTGDVHSLVYNHSDLCPKSLLAYRTNESFMDLLLTLQRVHDNLEPKTWPSRLRELALHWGLEDTVLRQFQEGSISC